MTNSKIEIGPLRRGQINILGTGNDTFNGSSGNDVVTGHTGNDVISTGGGSDVIIIGVTDGIDTIDGGTGLDTIEARSNNTKVHWTNVTGVEVVNGGTWSGVFITGTTGSDTLNLGGVNLLNIDRIEGGAGNDTIIGSAGNDKFVGGAGQDQMTGNGGSDTFVFVSTSQSSRTAPDTIMDFATGDLIDLSLVDANGGLAGNGTFTFVGTDAFTKVAGELRYDADTQSILGDVNGDGIADLRIVLSNGYVPTASDFAL